MADNRVFDTHVQGIKYKAVREIIKAYDENRMETAYIDIPKIALPGPKGTLRCCIYKERAIFQDRLRVVREKVNRRHKEHCGSNRHCLLTNVQWTECLLRRHAEVVFRTDVWKCVPRARFPLWTNIA